MDEDEKSDLAEGFLLWALIVLGVTAGVLLIVIVVVMTVSA